MPYSQRTSALQARKDMCASGGVGRSRFLSNVVAQLCCGPVLAAVVANAVVMENTQTVFKAGKSLTVEEALERLKEGRKSAQYLLDNYETICEGGGDNVRRYLGTVGVTSGLFGIGKVMSSLAEQANDFVEYTEISDEVLKSIQQADGSAYMAIFVATSTSQTPPSKYFEDAKIELKRCIKALDELALLINVKY